VGVEGLRWKRGREEEGLVIMGEEERGQVERGRKEGEKGSE